MVALLLIEAVFLVQILILWPLTGIFSSILPDVLVDLTNGNRAQNNIPSLKVNSLLEQAARLKAQDMAVKGYFAHTSPAGVEPWYWLAKVGYQYSGAGENLAINFSDSIDIDNAWMNSPGHRANILDNRFSEIGIATIKGSYQGKETVFVVQFFGRPARAASQEVSATDQKKPKPALAIKTTPLSSPSVAPEVMAVNNQSADAIFIASGTVASAVEPNVESRSIAPAKVSFWQRLVSMPKTATNIIYVAIAAIFLAALALKIFVKIKIQYPKLIFNGLILLFVIISILYMNYIIISPGSVF